jgi:archaellum component FlaC
MSKRFYDGFGMNDQMFKAVADKQQEYEYSLKEFDVFLKNLMTQYKALRKQIKGLMEIKG